MNQHTPGPWIIEVLEEANGKEQCLILGPMRQMGVFNRHDLVADVYPYSQYAFAIPENYWANARLIAAAPEMLALLTLIANYGTGVWAENAAFGMEAKALVTRILSP